MSRIDVSLFVSHRESRRNGFVGSVMRACERSLEKGFRLTVVDLDDDPQSALSRGLLATPALEVRTAHRTHLIIGDLGHEPRLIEHLHELTRE